MYQRSRKYQQKITQNAKAKAERERRRIEGHHPDYPPELPELRRKLVITDYDTGTPVTHQFELYRSNRIDCYNVWVDGRLWKERIGWSKVLEGLRKAMPRARIDWWN
ncbi:hypothetical protein GCM10011352_23850 [Marinobacterium zhoushanense]|uniref:Uncharacterized protein n=1 Tax=Marinobacterium zhoushanense TaxID=1679163 RepID=A0ABQ1KIN4_9GAMM|nr:hypothetical protein [Marinobacterium zhoushanense]GGB96936.1 hypothetical protein GCM10011352_23850 [Marinobacterium zhoushanense]